MSAGRRRGTARHWGQGQTLTSRASKLSARNQVVGNEASARHPPKTGGWFSTLSEFEAEVLFSFVGFVTESVLLFRLSPQFRRKGSLWCGGCGEQEIATEVFSSLSFLHSFFLFFLSFFERFKRQLKEQYGNSPASTTTEAAAEHLDRDQFHDGGEELVSNIDFANLLPSSSFPRKSVFAKTLC